MKVSIEDVARKAGVSVVTVSRVINEVATVREKNKEKVRAAMSELDYRPSPAARSLAGGKTGVIGLIIPTLSDAFIEQVVTAIDAKLTEVHYSLALNIVSDRDTLLRKRRDLFMQERFDGMILLTSLFTQDYLSELKRSRLPFVWVDPQLEPFPGPAIQVDNRQGALAATRYLVSLGHRRIWHVKGPDSYLSARERAQGYEAAMRQAGLQEEIQTITAGFSFAAGEKIGVNLASEKKRPTALLASDDLTALGLMQGLGMQGLSVPDDVSIIGFDDDPLTTKLRPYLTTVRQPAAQLAAEAVQQLLAEMKAPSYRSRKKLIAPKLIVRDSCRKL